LIHFYKRVADKKMLNIFLLSCLIASTLSAPGHSIVKKSGNVPARSGEDVRGPPYPLWHLEPLYVRKLPTSNPEKRSVSEEPELEPEDRSVSHVQESHSVFSNLNGNKQGFSKQIEQVSKNGQLVSSMSQEEKEDAKPGQKPRHHKMTKLDIPELNIHQQMEDNGEDDVRTNYVKRNAGLQMPTAEDMAEYILSTGDQQTVAQLIEAMVEGGEMSEEQALVIVETVKALLEGAEQELEEEAMREMIVERKMEEAAALEEVREEAEREAMYRRLVQTSGQRSPRRKSEENLYQQLKGVM